MADFVRSVSKPFRLASILAITHRAARIAKVTTAVITPFNLDAAICGARLDVTLLARDVIIAPAALPLPASRAKVGSIRPVGVPRVLAASFFILA